MTISVIIPVYNVGELLRESVDSLISQLGDDCEVIIVDDGSTDNSGRLCDEYSGIKNVQVIHKTNGGLSSARNAGIDHASGQYLLFLDSDDYLRPGSLALL
ncbi:MAG: glycosyltransferase, partial [Muribaculaceae bacterium]|nr:glycosyltransferase [Muribaculaceae bacterium]